MKDEKMFAAIVKAVDDGKIKIEDLPATEDLKKAVADFIAQRDGGQE